MTKKKTKTTQVDDPNKDREAKKYASPIASREFIKSILVKEGAPLDFQQLVERLEFVDMPEQQEALRRRVAAMLRDAQLIKNRKGGFVPIDDSDLIAGRVSAHPDGFGFLIADGGGADIYLNGKQMRQVLHGDRTVVCITGTDRRGRREGRIVDVVERANHQIVGRLMEEQGVFFIAPDNRRIHQDLLIPENARQGAKPGDMVIADIVEQPTRKHPPVGKVATVLGQHLKPGMETDVAIASHEIPHEWPQDVLDSIASLTEEVLEKDKEGRRDVRKLPLVTIDGEDARDFDDAVYCEPRDNGWRLYVAIADVSHYVQPDSAIDKEATKRGTSVYFPSRVVPMLPEILSNGLCSINPDIDRLCMLCEMTLGKTGDLEGVRFYKGLMRSHARLTYNKVAAMLVDKDRDLRKQYQQVLPHLENLHRLFKVLVKQRKKRGAIEFESNETRIIFDDQKKIKEIVPVQRNDAHKMIEECMILANIAAAGFLEKRKMPALYRVHASPKADKLDDLRAFLALRGLSLGGGDTPTSLDYAQLSRKVADLPDATIIQTVMLRSMQQAVYQPVNEGHFGLALDEYAHFTSPIRRYPDLLVHRAIAHVLAKEKVSNYRYSQSDMISLGESCSMTERRADEASRDVTSWLKCEYMLEHVGDEFDGVVSAVTSFGLFIQLSDIFVEGLVHITSLDSDYYHFDQAAHTLTGERMGVRFRLGDPLRVRVSAVNLEERKIDFQPAEVLEKSGRKKPTTQKNSSAPKKKDKNKKKSRKQNKAKSVETSSGTTVKEKKNRKKTTSKKTNKNKGKRRSPSNTVTTEQKESAAKGKTKKTTSKKTSSKKVVAKKVQTKKLSDKKKVAKKAATKKSQNKKTGSARSSRGKASGKKP